jgi:hypothetical protein
MESVMESVKEHLPRLGIPSCFLSLYSRSARQRGRADADTLRLLLAHDESQPGPIARRSEVFPALELVPRDLLPRDRPRAYVVQPLVSSDHALGLMLLELSDTSGAMYEALRAQISAAVTRVQLASDVIRTSSYPAPQS